MADPTSDFSLQQAAYESCKPLGSWVGGPPAEGRLLHQVVGPDPGRQGAEGEGSPGGSGSPRPHGAGGHGE